MNIIDHNRLSSSTARPRPVTDDEAALWYCQTCRKSGVLSTLGASFYAIVWELESDHGAQSPECGGIGHLVIARPTRWYEDMRKAERLAAVERELKPIAGDPSATPRQPPGFEYTDE